jgi:hypothetical protein
MVVHVVSQITVSGRATAPKGERCDIEIPVCRVVRQSARRSRPTLLSRSVDQRSRLAIGGETPHALELDRSTSQGHERLKLLGACPDTAGSRIQPGAPRCDARSDRHCGDAFSPLAQSRSQLDKVPRRPLLVSTTANQNERPTWHG